ncbi:hypothetical protein HPB51_009060 [Rhipicephalus microplus]|uniref:Probable aminopeptidase NPEPL1 N-terminal domain-containing protein n=1 Tax=Rhipicephalus microplus TaxID=6941 RepID=A0A9J6D8V8_RHIMP|nr:hypothetical protein HPB51_009060 [Rhipicephalus microplus]
MLIESLQPSMGNPEYLLTSEKFLSMCKTVLKFSGHLTPSDPLHHPVLIIGQPRNLAKITFDHVKCKLEPRVGEEMFQAAVGSLRPSPTDNCFLYLNLAIVAALPTKCSRHNTPSHAHSLTKLVKNLTAGVDEYIVLLWDHRNSQFWWRGCPPPPPQYGSYMHSEKEMFRIEQDWNPGFNHSTTEPCCTTSPERFLLRWLHWKALASWPLDARVVCEWQDVFASACAVARAFPVFSRKSTGTPVSHCVTVEFLLVDGVGGCRHLGEPELRCLTAAAEGIQLTAKIVDSPCRDMNTEDFIKEVEIIGSALGLKPTIIKGEELNAKGFGGVCF